MVDVPTKADLLMDLYFYTLQFCREVGWGPEKTSTFFSIVKATHEETISTPFYNLKPVFEVFKDLLLKHSVQRPPWSVAVFDLGDVKTATQWMSTTYFRHFKLYKATFTDKQVMNIKPGEIHFDTPPATLPPLAEGEMQEEPEPETSAESGEGIGPDGVALASSSSATTSPSATPGTRSPEITSTPPQDSVDDSGSAIGEADGLVLPPRDVSRGTTPRSQGVRGGPAWESRVEAAVSSALSSAMEKIRMELDESFKSHEASLSERLSGLEKSLGVKTAGRLRKA